MKASKNAGCSARYEARAPGERRAEFKREYAASAPEHPPRGSAKKAVLVVHGMGQQQPFDTLVSVAEGLLGEGRRRGSLAEQHAAPRAVRVQLGAEQLARFELSLAESGGHDVHVYEAYWAQLTEGRIKLRDVMAFLIEAGKNGLFNAPGGRFQRWVLGELRAYAIPMSHLLHLALALAVVASLMCINTAIAAVVGSHFFSGTEPVVFSMEASQQVWGLFHVEVLAALLFALSLKIVGNGLQRVFFCLLILATLGSGLGSLLLLIGGAFPGGAGGVSSALSWFAGSPWVRIISGPTLVVISIYARGLIVQYVGDVAAYISSHKLDRFDEIRTAIRTRVANTARAIYAAKNADGSFFYESVAIVGHSLGSVIAYDALNRQLNDDALCTDASLQLDVLARTNLLLTFGSPLDKIAYVFGKRDKEFVLRGRSALAATSQPLILSEEFRSIPWLNVYSPHDIISGSLKLYDVPGEDGKPTPWRRGKVENIEDTEATTFIAAHVQYWSNTEIWKQLYPYLEPTLQVSAQAQLTAVVQA